MVMGNISLGLVGHDFPSSLVCQQNLINIPKIYAVTSLS
jgi:hypothetical protein